MRPHNETFCVWAMLVVVVTMAGAVGTDQVVVEGVVMMKGMTYRARALWKQSVPPMPSTCRRSTEREMIQVMALLS